jgi:hypothetical protein
MFDSIQHDVTPIGSYGSSVEMRQYAFTPLPQRKQGGSLNTRFVLFENNVPFHLTDSDLATTGNLSRWDTAVSNVQHGEDISDDPISKTARDRRVLLSNKYAGKLNNEEASRLDILTERLRKLSPRVSTSEINALSEMVDGLEAMNLRLAAIKARY